MRRLTTVLLPLALASTVAMTGCSSSSPDVSTSVGATAESAPASGASLDSAEFAAALKATGTVLLDVRTPAEFAAGHLPGAQNADINDPAFAQTVAALSKDVPYAVYCQSGNRSAKAVALMQAAGITQVYDLSGGIVAWKKDGGDIAKG